MRFTVQVYQHHGCAYPVYSWKNLDPQLLIQLRLCQLEISWLNDLLLSSVSKLTHLSYFVLWAGPRRVCCTGCRYSIIRKLDSIVLSPVFCVDESCPWSTVRWPTALWPNVIESCWVSSKLSNVIRRGTRAIRLIWILRAVFSSISRPLGLTRSQRVFPVLRVLSYRPI